MHEIRLDLIDSTQTYAKAHVGTLPKEGISCVVANEQTAGYGRFGRAWVSPPGVGLHVTFYTRLPSDTPGLTCLAQLLAWSLAQVLLDAGLAPKVKWPNDVQLHGKKLAGILCETIFQGQSVDLFLGIGVNVNTESADLAKIDQPATSLKAETGSPWDKDALLKKLQTQFASDLATFRKGGFAPFRAPLERLLAYKGEQVRCSDGTHEWVGICHSLAPNGELQIELPDGSLHAVRSGEVHLRAHVPSERRDKYSQ